MKNALYTKWFLLPALFLYLSLFILPNLMSFVLGFTDWNISRLFTIKFVGLENFKQMFSESIFWLTLKNTLYYTIVVTICVNVFGFLLALLLNAKIRFRGFYRSAFFIPVTLSPMVVAVVFVAIYNPYSGIINIALNKSGLGMFAQAWIADPRYAMNSVIFMTIWKSVGFSMMIYLAGFQAISKDYYEAAQIDGAGFFQKIMNITIPLSLPALINNVILSLIGGLKVFSEVYGLTNGGPADSTQVFSTFIFKSFSQGLLGYSSAVGLIFTILVCLLSFLIVASMRRLEVEM